jgi:hypothetical protein
VFTYFARRHFGVLLAVLIGDAALFSAGCSRSPENQMQDVMRRVYTSNGRRLAVLYGRYMNRPLDKFPGRNGFRGPASAAEFRSFIAAMEPHVLHEFGVDAVAIDRLFISERDGRPLDVRYGIVGDLSTGYAVVFDGPAADGTTTVFMTDGSTISATEADAKKYRDGTLDVKPLQGSASQDA